jgi:hypothetical protein
VLARRGLTKEMLKQFDSLAETVARLESSQELHKKTSRASTMAVYEILDEGLAWWRESRQMVKVEFSHDPDKSAEFRTGVKVGRSIPKLIREMEFNVMSFDKYANAFKWLGGAEHVRKGRDILVRLRQADAEQETGRKDLPRETEELCFQKGELYDLGRKIVRLAHLAWLGDPAKAAAYSYEILRRGSVAAKGAKTRKAKKAQ